MSLLFNGKPVLGSMVDVINGNFGTLKCIATSNPLALFVWNINQKVGDTLTIDNSIQNGQIVNCTARNIMLSTAGVTVNGYRSISKKINLQCEYRDRPRQTLFSIQAGIRLRFLSLLAKEFD